VSGRYPSISRTPPLSTARAKRISSNETLLVFHLAPSLLRLRVEENEAVRFEPHNGRHDDATEKRIRRLEKKLELVGVQLALIDQIDELEGSREKVVKEPEVYGLVPEEPGANHLY
jgi:hypothetical protein